MTSSYFLSLWIEVLLPLSFPLAWFFCEFTVVVHQRDTAMNCSFSNFCANYQMNLQEFILSVAMQPQSVQSVLVSRLQENKPARTFKL